MVTVIVLAALVVMALLMVVTIAKSLTQTSENVTWFELLSNFALWLASKKYEPGSRSSGASRYSVLC